ncbi:hypothetical protein ABF87_13140 [Nitrosomonas sp. JL21]|uniref:hypothetical protein n=1 Tax=Nitrosomonas sp. JL21 TaxID=153949 RepID=UPI00136953C1|nr:hypothetical protein [Nitrosomonas sp. JL21]MBL8497660.1 hypothetical protein [Nitrosomonas sp.]MXS78881.1 hypothetical protein [Nitrosomonas sp. JL21]
MFDKSNQLIFYINSALTIIGVLIALLTNFVVIGIIIAVCGALLIVDQFRQNKFAFTIDDLKKILKVHDTGGSKATLTQTQKTTSCHSGNSEYWFRHIRAIGSVSNFQINNGHLDEPIKENGSYHVCMKIPPEINMIRGLDLALSYEYEDAFTQTEGFLSHTVDNDTRRLHLAVELPKGRPVSSARLFCKYKGTEESLLPPVVTGETKIEADIKNPIVGAEYCLQWQWSEEGLIKKLGHLFKI